VLFVSDETYDTYGLALIQRCQLLRTCNSFLHIFASAYAGPALFVSFYHAKVAIALPPPYQTLTNLPSVLNSAISLKRFL
jgi:hypothetical protein